MKTMRKILSLLIAIVMTMGTVLVPKTASAAEVTDKTESVTVHKLLATEGHTLEDIQNALKDTYVGTDIDENGKNISDLYSQVAKEIDGVYFAWQNADGNWINENGEVVNTVDDAMGGLTTKDGLKFNTSNLQQEKATEYKIVEVREKSTYRGENGETLSGMLAVPVEITLPLVNKAGVQKDVHVYPKNTETGKPDVSKTEDEENPDKVPVTGGNVTVGDKVPYKVETTIQAGSTYKEVSWNDRMSEGLTFDKNVVIRSDQGLTWTKDTDYTLDYTDNGFVLRLTNAGLRKLGEVTAPTKAAYQIDGQDVVGENTAVKFTLTYTATVNGDALVDNTLENTVTFHYGNKPGFKPLPGDKNPIPETGKTEIPVSKAFVSGDDMGTTETWPADMSISLKLEVYNPETNTWSDASKSITLNSGQTSGTFTELDKNKTYRVVEESVTGWVPNYSLDTDGKLVINNRKNENPEPETPEPVIVRTGGHRFRKENQNGEGLPGAQFVVKKGDKYLKEKDTATKEFEQKTYAEAEVAYKQAVKDGANDIQAKKEARDEAYRKVKSQWEFTASTEEDAFKFISDESGYFKVTGLEYGDYQLVEFKQPDGYAKLNKPVDFTVAANSMGETTLESDKLSDAGLKVIENKQVTIPQTGGIGSIIFVVAGLMLMGLAAYKMKANKEEA